MDIFARVLLVAMLLPSSVPAQVRRGRRAPSWSYSVHRDRMRGTQSRLACLNSTNSEMVGAVRVRGVLCVVNPDGHSQIVVSTSPEVPMQDVRAVSLRFESMGIQSVGCELRERRVYLLGAGNESFIMAMPDRRSVTIELPVGQFEFDGINTIDWTRVQPR